MHRPPLPPPLPPRASLPPPPPRLRSRLASMSGDDNEQNFRTTAEDVGLQQQMEDLCYAPRPDPLDPTRFLAFCNAGWAVDGKCMANQLAHCRVAGRWHADGELRPCDSMARPVAPPCFQSHHSLPHTRDSCAAQGIGSWIASWGTPVPLDTCSRDQIRRRDFEACSANSRRAPASPTSTLAPPQQQHTRPAAAAAAAAAKVGCGCTWTFAQPLLVVCLQT